MHPDVRNRLVALACGVTRVTRVTGVTPPPLSDLLQQALYPASQARPRNQASHVSHASHV
jgi:hypothetical protein